MIQPLDVWTQYSGFNLGTFPAEKNTDIPLPVHNTTGVTFTIISGSLPDNMYLIGHHLIGSPFVLKNKLNYSFCIRAVKYTNGAITGLSDRTFTLLLTENNAPFFVTNSGELDIGNHKQFYALDGSFINYQLDALDLNASGGPLTYFIAEGDGTLPPGITLDASGLLSGYLQPIYAITTGSGNGAFDSAIYDGVAYDFGVRPSDGFDDYEYDTIKFDFSTPTQQVKTLNANYQFKVTVSDGISIAQRVFRIFVVGNDQFRADSTGSLGSASTFTADATYLREPVWISKSNLGLFRANNYLTIPLALYDNSAVGFRLEVTNQEVYTNAFLFLRAPVGPGKATDNIINSNQVTITNTQGTPLQGQYFSLLHYLPGASGEIYEISNVEILPGLNNYRLTLYTNLNITIPAGTHFYIGSLSTLPPGSDNKPTTTNLEVLTSQGTNGVATLTFPTQTETPYRVGQPIAVSGVEPEVYNGTYIVKAATPNSVSYASSATGDILYEALSISVVNAGRGYTVGDLLTFTTSYGSCVAVVSQLNSTGYAGVATANLTISPADRGKFSVAPTGTLVPTVSPAGGINATFNIVFRHIKTGVISSTRISSNTLTFDEQTGEVYGVLPYQPAITKTYKFTVTSTRYGAKSESISASKTFTISIIGDITGQITWTTPSDLGYISANYPSTLKLSATTTVTNSTINYTIESGQLPNGLILANDGEIIGQANQFFDPIKNTLGLITIDGGATTFNNQTTTFDRQYTFTVKASDQFNYTASTQTFVLKVSTPNSVTYSNIIARPFLTTSQRSTWKTFINNTDIFDPASVYRPNDPTFGIKTDLSMLIYAGLQTAEAAAYVGAVGLNHKRKRFQFGDVVKAVAVDPVTNQPAYEVIYVQMVDPTEVDGVSNQFVHTSNTIDGNKKITIDTSNSIWSRDLVDLSIDAPDARRPVDNITADSMGYEAGNSSITDYYLSSVYNWRQRLSNVSMPNGDQAQTERNYLPLWMRTIQSASKYKLGYVLALPLCFCVPGAADKILLNIKNSEFDFKVLDYTIDRYIIDAVLDSQGRVFKSDKYIVFRNDRITV